VAPVRRSSRNGRHLNERLFLRAQRAPPPLACAPVVHLHLATGFGRLIWHAPVGGFTACVWLPHEEPHWASLAGDPVCVWHCTAWAGGKDPVHVCLSGAGEDQPCCGFGFGDAVIMELLADRRLLPGLAHAVEDVVLAMDEGLRPVACRIAQRLRAAGR
jgi:hypothetical protein